MQKQFREIGIGQEVKQTVVIPFISMAVSTAAVGVLQTDNELLFSLPRSPSRPTVSPAMHDNQFMKKLPSITINIHTYIICLLKLLTEQLLHSTSTVDTHN